MPDLFADTHVRELFEEYARQQELVETRRRDLAEAETAASAIIGEIYDARGKGPYVYKGVKLTIVAKTNGVYYFRGRGKEREAIEIG